MGTRKQNRFKNGPFSSICFRVLPVIWICLLLIPHPIPATDIPDLPAGMQSILDAPCYRHARWGLFVQDLTSDKTLYALNADTMFGPASVTKLFTAAAALDELGGDFSFRTPLYRQGSIDSSGRLNGHLFLVAQGDMFFSDFRPLARQIKASGIKAVHGDLVIDDRLFKPYRAYSVKNPGKLLYVLPPVLAHGNVVELAIRPIPNHALAAVSWMPTAPYLRVSASVRTVECNEPEKIDLSEDTAGHLTVKGRIPADAPVATLTVPVGDPSSLFRSLLIDALKKAGIPIQASSRRSNPAGRLPAPDAYDKTLKKVAEHVSPPLADYVRTILKTSHNQGADMLPLVLAAKKSQQTFAEGMQVERNFLARAGIDLHSIALGDGSGISQANLVTPRTVVHLLKFMTTHRDYDAFRQGLPILGVDGTLAKADSGGGSARGKVLAKTGTIGLFDLLNDSGFVQVKALAGYMTAASGHQLAFALFVNHVHVTDAPDRQTVTKLTSDVGADLVRIAGMIHDRH